MSTSNRSTIDTENARLLIVEDDPEVGTGLEDFFSIKGYDVTRVEEGEEALQEITALPPYDVILLDVMLPEKDGFEVLREARKAGVDSPIIMLTVKSESKHKLRGFDLGADDYVTKPFRIEELMARVHALLRRSAGHAAPTVEIGPLVVNLSSQQARLGDEALELTSFEYRVLEYFLLHPGQVVSKMELNEHLYDEDADPDSNVIEVIIGRLRRKLDPAGEWQPIETLRGRGYRFRQDAD